MSTNPYQPSLNHDVIGAAPLGQISSPNDSAFSLSWFVIRSRGWSLLLSYWVIWLPIDFGIAFLESHLVGVDDSVSALVIQQAGLIFIGSLSSGAAMAITLFSLDGRGTPAHLGYGDAFSRYFKVLTTRLCFSLVFGLGLVLLVLPGLFFFVRCIYAESVALRENLHGPSAIRRSIELSRGRFFEAFAYAMVTLGVYFVSSLVFFIAYLPLWFAVEEMGFLNTTWWLDALCMQVFVIPVVYGVVLCTCGYWRLVQWQSAPA